MYDYVRFDILLLDCLYRDTEEINEIQELPFLVNWGGESSFNSPIFLMRTSCFSSFRLIGTLPSFFGESKRDILFVDSISNLGIFTIFLKGGINESTSFKKIGLFFLI